MPAPATLLLLAALGAGTPGAECRIPRPDAPAALPNDNRTPAGTLRPGALELRLAVRLAGWYPEGPRGCGLAAHAFAEEGKPARIPGPLLRVRVGTQVRVTVRNELATSIRVAGLHDRAEEPADTPRIAAGEVREFAFRATVPGTYFYRAFTAAAPRTPDLGSQLAGAFIVDPPGAVADDRVFVITRWRRFIPVPAGAAPQAAADPAFPVGQRVLAAVNGLSWPHTERLSATEGDTLRWRVINADPTAAHPLHLHGFYFRIDARGGLTRDTAFEGAQRRMAVTEALPPWRTLAIAWSPDRPGNWLFHCHMIGHMSPRQRLGRILADSAAGRWTSAVEAAESGEHAAHGGMAHEMAGLILGITVAPRHLTRAAPQAPEPQAAQPAAPQPARRRLRLFAQRHDRVFGERPGYGFVLQQGDRAPAPDSIRIPGSELALTRGEPVEITVLNRAAIPLSVHWHGIELESFYDGVAGWSGEGRTLAPTIAPGDSFVVRMTPPRAGTFIYHVHDEGGVELVSGLYGALVVREPGSDGSDERVLVVADAGPERPGITFVNGSTSPEPVELLAGRTYRLRLVAITANGGRNVWLTGPAGPHPWRLVARDGWEHDPKGPLTSERLRAAPGTTFDLEVTLDAPGDYTLTAAASAGQQRLGPPTVVPIRVRRP